ncbi:hypothetical protein MWU53_09745 [Aliiroseovarius sp. S1123]|uniref:hypothetical protein n=1 Tax=unclassified Aliiroseovarius TaxID=2623558 RepID=UPI001FF4FF52|nr:hypothetical protein [Aliiroseovarius sp. S1123]MCK0171338.1 hypothetical protein [Aliiroseovarius sp. S1123]
MSDPSIPDWINAIAAAVGAVAVVVGLFGANSKLNEARRTARQLRRSEVAEELVALAHNVDDALRDIRNPMDSIPKDKAGDKLYAYQRRYERIVKYNDLFKSLRDAQIRVRAVIGDKEVDGAVELLFKARQRVAIAIELLADYIRDDVGARTLEERDHKIKLRHDMYGSFSDRDELGQSVADAVQLIERHLNPIARLEKN